MAMSHLSDIDSDSDDDLPSVEDLVKSFKSVSTKASVTGTGTAKKEERGVEGRRVKEIGNRGKEVGVGVKKKRVLNSKADNPLLRPLNAAGSRPRTGVMKGGSRDVTPSLGDEKKEGVRKACLDESFDDEERVKSKAPKRLLERRILSGRSRLEEKVSLSKDDGSGKEKLGSKRGDEKRIVPGNSGLVLGAKVPKVRTIGTKEESKGKREGKKGIELKLEMESETEQEEHYDSDGLSDFIIDDSTFHEEEEDSILEIPPPPPPRSTRKLVQGRKIRKVEEFDDDDLDLELGKLNIKDVPERAVEKGLEDLFSDEEEVSTKTVPRKLFEDVRMEPPTRRKEASPEKKYEAPTSDIEDPFVLKYSPPTGKARKVSKETRFATPPGSPEPKPRGLQSPKKTFQRIPATPHRQSMDTFWQQDVVNDWNDEYSPRKTPAPPKPLTSEDDGDDTSTNLITPPKKQSPTKQDRQAKEAKKLFSQRKHELATSFLTELDSKITSSQISTLAASTGGIKIIWSKKLNTTAGRANWKRETIRTSSSLPPTYRHHASIELAEKVIDCEDRLHNVIAHEFCHLANFMVSNVKNNPHGKEFKSWAGKVSKEFGERGIEVTTKHSYAIDYKFVWECGSCGVLYKRHSRSVDPARHTCGSCKGRLVQIKPVPREGTGGGEKKLGEYQLFVKENMRKVKEENPGSPQKEIMGLVGKRYKEFKAGKLGAGGMTAVSVDEVVEKVGEVARELDFLDLTSP